MTDSRTEEELWISKKELDDDEELSHNENVATVEAMMFEISSISLHVVLQIVTLVQQQATVATGGSEISSMMCLHMTEFGGFSLTESLIATTSSVMIVIMSATRKYLSKFMCSPSMRVCDIPVMFVTTKPLKEED